jgi:predicted dehydrogenase
MRFALLGNHPDGVEMTSALVASGRFQLAAYTAPVAEPLLRAWGEGARKLHDLEEVLADPQIELVIVAGVEANRPAQLRRALQAERHVLAVHPSDRTPEIAYEAAMIQKDTGYVLLPLLPDALHPAVAGLKRLLSGPEKGEATAPALGEPRLLEMTRPPPPAGQGTDPGAERKPTFPGWDVLRALAGEIAEVSGFAAREEVRADETVLVCGRFERGGLFQMTFARADDHACRLVAHGSRGRAELFFPQGWRGPAFLSYRDADGEPREEAWPAWDPWTALVAQLDSALAGRGPASRAGPTPGVSAASTTVGAGAPVREGLPRRLSWEDEIRCLELDEAVRRSVERRRSSTLEYQEASEEVGFKGTMTLLGCGLMWVLLTAFVVLAVVAQGVKSSKSGLEEYLPQGVGAATCVGVVFGLPLALFLLLQLLRLLTRKNP